MQLQEHIDAGTPIAFVDGDCAICNRSALILLRRDRTQTILVAALQTPLGQEACAAVGQDPSDFDTALFLHKGTFYTKSTAVLRIALHFSAILAFFARLGLLVPRAVRDWFYDRVAKNRYRMNKSMTCRIPPPELRQRFLD